MENVRTTSISNVNESKQYRYYQKQGLLDIKYYDSVITENYDAVGSSTFTSRKGGNKPGLQFYSIVSGCKQYHVDDDELCHSLIGSSGLFLMAYCGICYTKKLRMVKICVMLVKCYFYPLVK